MHHKYKIGDKVIMRDFLFNKGVLGKIVGWCHRRHSSDPFFYDVSYRGVTYTGVGEDILEFPLIEYLEDLRRKYVKR